MIGVPDLLNKAAARHHISVVKTWQRQDGQWCIQLFQEYHPYPDGSGEYVTGRGNDLSKMCQDLVQYLTHVEDVNMNIFKMSGLFNHLVGEMFLDDSGRPIVVPMTIKDVVMDRVPDGRGKEIDKPVIQFGESDKTLVLNKTNARAVAGLYGAETDSWIGKRISISGEKGKWFGKEQTRVIVLATAPPPKNGRRKKATPKDEPTQTEIDLMVQVHEANQPPLTADDIPWDEEE